MGDWHEPSHSVGVIEPAKHYSILRLSNASPVSEIKTSFFNFNFVLRTHNVQLSASEHLVSCHTDLNSFTQCKSLVM
jgi:hypothetical protein